MIWSVPWQRIAFAVGTLASLALLLYTIGAPFEHGG